jgi:hypothetical protein
MMDWWEVDTRMKKESPQVQFHLVLHFQHPLDMMLLCHEGSGSNQVEYDPLYKICQDSLYDT